MVAKRLTFDQEANQAIKSGVEKIYDAVRFTLGPSGYKVIIDKSWGAPTITRDGASIAEEVELIDPTEDMGAKMIKESASKTADEAGDGSTTSVVLAGAIFREGYKRTVGGVDPLKFRAGLDKLVEAACEQLKKLSRKIDVKDKDMITSAGTICAGGKKEVGEMLYEAFSKVGKDGAISVEEGKTTETQIKLVEGMQFDRGFLSPHFVTNQDSVEAVLDNPYILIWEEKISSAKKLVPLLEKISQAKRPLLIISEDVDGDAIATLVVNKLRGVLQVCAVKAPGYGDRRKAMMEDIAILTGGKALFKELGVDLEKVTIKDLGQCKRVIVDQDYTTIISGKGSKQDVDARCAQIRKEIEDTDSDYDREKLQERLSKLTGGVAQINVGASTETELKENKKLVENALSSVRSALETGVVPGGGSSYLKVISSLKGVDLPGEQKYALDALTVALEAPIRQIAENSGNNPSIVAKNVAAKGGNFGFDALTGEVVDMYQSGIVDSLKVVEHALRNAASIAGLLLSADTLVNEIKEEKKEAAVPPGGGMGGGMPGMYD